MQPDRFRALLLESGLSQRELARLLGVSPGVVNRWCSVRRRDWMPAPGYAVAFVMVWMSLHRAVQAQLASDIRAVVMGQCVA